MATEPFSLARSSQPRIHVLEVVGNAIVGGMEVYVERLVERLPRERFTVTVLCPFEGPFAQRLRGTGAEVVVTPMPDDPSWASIQLALALVERHHVDILHAHLPNAHALAGLVGHLAGRPVLATLHGHRIALQDLEVHLATGSHLCTVCNASLYHALGLGVRPAFVTCVANGVDLDVFRPRPRPREGGGLRGTLGLSSHVPLVGFVGRLAPEKGPEVFLRAAFAVCANDGAAHCVLVGDGPLAETLRRVVDRRGLASRVHFAGVQADMARVYNDLDLLVASSHSEAAPLAVMEAMASGVPVVATRVGGLPEIVAHGETGWLAAPGDDEDLARRACQLLASPSERERFAMQARARAEETLSLADSVKGVADLLERLVRAMPARTAATAGAGAARPLPRPVLATTGASNDAKGQTGA